MNECLPQTFSDNNMDYVNWCDNKIILYIFLFVLFVFVKKEFVKMSYSRLYPRCKHRILMESPFLMTVIQTTGQILVKDQTNFDNNLEL
jgi:hypothetical protein